MRLLRFSDFFILFLIISSFLSYSQNPISLPTEYKQQPFDVVHYDATIDLLKGMEKRISGVCSIYFKWTQNPQGKNFYFHLKDLNVDSAFYLGKKVSVTFQREDTLDYSYYILSNLEGNEGDTVVATIYYSGVATNEGGNNPFGGVFLIDSVFFANGVGFQNEYVSATQHWLPSYDHPSDKATFKFKFIFPLGFQVATNGKIEEFGLVGDSANYIVASSKFPIATYLMTFALGRFKKATLDPWNLPGNIEKVVYYLPQDEEAVLFAFNNFAKYFYSLQNRFGRYPFEQIGYVVVPFENGAMEHQTMITFPSNYVQRLYTNRDTNNIMALHELSHQWFGNSVSPLDFRDAWFNESFATFSESVYLDMMFGTDAYLKDLLRKKNYYINYVTKKEGLLPLYGFSRKSPSSNYPSTIYVKGAVVIGMLRYMLGDEMFFDLIRNYLDYFAYQSCSTNDFLNYSVGYTLQNLYWFFEQWVFQSGYPNLEIRVTQYVHNLNKASAFLTIRQTQPHSYGQYFNIPVELNFLLPNNKTLDTVVILPFNELTSWIDSLPPFVSFNTNLGRKVVSLFSSNIYTSIEEENREDYYCFYLNDKVIIRIPVVTAMVDFSIYDVFGRLVFSGKNHITNGLAQIDVSFLSNGIYFVFIDTGNGWKKMKFIKN